MNYASRWARILALLVDDLVVIGVPFALWNWGHIGVNPIDPRENLAQFIGFFVVFLLYYVAPTAVYGATLGKAALRIRVVRADGGKPGIRAALTREVIVRWLEHAVTVGLVYALGAILVDSGSLAAGLAGLGGGIVTVAVAYRILIDERRQGWHDKAAGTFVVKKP